MNPKPVPSVLHALADGYARTRAARTGAAKRDYFIDYEELLGNAGSATGEARICAERELHEAQQAGLLKIIRHRRTKLPLQVRFFIAEEERMFARIGRPPPRSRRMELARLFERAEQVRAPEHRADGWREFCRRMQDAATAGRSLAPFSRDRPEEISEILRLLPRLLEWEGESLIRFASARLCGNSKRMEQLQAKLETCLAQISGGEIRRLAELGILPNARAVTLHGPMQLVLPHGTVDTGLLQSPCRVDRRDLLAAEIRTAAGKCLTVENAAMLQELAKLNSGVLLAGSGSEGGFAHSAVVTFLAKLPTTVELHHFGDSDPAGFDILRDLRRRTGRSIRSVWMRFRPAHADTDPLTKQDHATLERLLQGNDLTTAEKDELVKMRDAGCKGRFEQESLGQPNPSWPFYPE